MLKISLDGQKVVKGTIFGQKSEFYQTTFNQKNEVYTGVCEGPELDFDIKNEFGWSTSGQLTMSVESPNHGDMA